MLFFLQKINIFSISNIAFLTLLLNAYYSSNYNSHNIGSGWLTLKLTASYPSNVKTLTQLSLLVVIRYVYAKFSFSNFIEVIIFLCA